MSLAKRYSEFTSSQLRIELAKFIDIYLKVDSDFECCCKERFPDAWMRLSPNLDRLSQRNILLNSVSGQNLINGFSLHFADDTMALQSLHSISQYITAEELEREKNCAELKQLCTKRARLIKQEINTQSIDISIRILKRSLRSKSLLQIGEVLESRYQLESISGSGGWGTVYQAIDLRDQEIVAIKVMASSGNPDSAKLDRFTRGALQMMKLDHPNIVRVPDPPREQDGFHYFVMEHIDGGTLRDAILERRLSVKHKLQVLLEVGDALSYMHGLHIIHRDVTPKNILLTRKLQAKLTDFDLVWALHSTGGTQAGLGTHGYAPPEQIYDASDTKVTFDVYALAMVTIFVLLGEDLPKIRASELIKKLSIRTALRRLLSRATNDNPDQRPNLSEFLDELVKWWPLTNDIKSISPEKTIHDSRTSIEDRWRLLGKTADLFGVIGGVLVTGLIFYTAFNYERARKHEQELQAQPALPHPRPVSPITVEPIQSSPKDDPPPPRKPIKARPKDGSLLSKKPIKVPPTDGQPSTKPAMTSPQKQPSTTFPGPNPFEPDPQSTVPTTQPKKYQPKIEGLRYPFDVPPPE